jgi:M6 family metalloprotease-like protein
MRYYRIFITGLLLSLVSLTAVAQEGLSPMGCRRGTPRPESILRRGGAEGRKPGGNFYHGERHQLTVLVEFNDRKFIGDESATLTQWNKIFNTKDLSEEPFNGSVHDYFLAQSYGDFSVLFDLVFVQVSGDAKKYASTSSHDEYSQYLVQDIMEVLMDRNDIEWDRYDWNGDGNINQLLIVYAGHGMNDSNDDDLIWPHQWWMSEHLKDCQQGVYCDPIPLSYGGKEYMVDCYCALNELTNENDYGSFGTICHEYTHCFGFPDFYYGSTQYVYSWDLMDSGNYNGDGYIPPGYSAHERWLMGWLSPIELQETTTVTDMPALAEQGRAYLIHNDGYENEYYIIENRQPLGWDAGLPGSGILVFHIDYDPSVWTSTRVVPNSPSRKRYEIFHANNMISPYRRWTYPYQDNNSLTNTSLPASTLYNDNIDGTNFMSKPITNMTVTNGLASFDFSESPMGIISVASGTDQLLYRFGVIDIVRDAKGNVKKVIRK